MWRQDNVAKSQLGIPSLFMSCIRLEEVKSQLEVEMDQWDIGTRECLHTLTGHTKGVTCVVYSSKGHQVVSGSADMTTRLWDVTSGQCRSVVKGINSALQSIAWSTTSDASDVNCFVAGYGDGNVRMWQVVENGDACHVR